MSKIDIINWERIPKRREINQVQTHGSVCTGRQGWTGRGIQTPAAASAQRGLRISQQTPLLSKKQRGQAYNPRVPWVRVYLFVHPSDTYEYLFCAVLTLQMPSTGCWQCTVDKADAGITMYAMRNERSKMMREFVFAPWETSPSLPTNYLVWCPREVRERCISEALSKAGHLYDKCVSVTLIGTSFLWGLLTALAQLWNSYLLEPAEHPATTACRVQPHASLAPFNIKGQSQE